jgi:thiol:disulfide interchange protein DsbD
MMTGHSWRFVFGVAVWLLATTTSPAVNTTATLLLEATSARQGEQVMAGVRLKMAAGWHNYWKNSGASGAPTEIAWDLPTGIVAGEIQWPLPSRLSEQDLTTYIYEKEVVLLVPLTISTSAPPGEVTIKADVSWLECEKLCIPGDAKIQASLAIGTTRKASPEAGTLTGWRAHLPGVEHDLGAEWRWNAPASDTKTRQLLLSWKSKPGDSAIEFFPYASEHYEIAADHERVATGSDRTTIRLALKRLGDKWPDTIAGVLALGAGPERIGYEIRGPVGDPGAAAAAPARSLWLMLVYAFIGGLILNIMPCVLPVIALKILGFVGQAHEHPGRIRQLGLIYALGVLASFLILAGLVIGVKAAGHSAGWGMQFGSPVFLVLLTILVTLVALNLFGLFEVTAGAKVMDAAGSLVGREGAPGAFFNGVLATVLATPCTAPFLGIALGFAFAQNPGVILLVFATVAAGLAAPYVLLSWQPGWLRFLPKPGAWMERFKVGMGFPMLATAVWLFSLTLTFYRERAWWLGLTLVVIALAAWIFGEFVQRGSSRRGLAVGLTAALLIAAYAFGLERELQWRSPVEAIAPTATTGKIAWEPWSHEALTRAREASRPVLVDFTADWCLTCQANKKFALEVPSVIARLKELNAVTLLGDYTRVPPVITKELQKFGRAGVPLVLVYPADRTRDPRVLPEALTPSIVLDALEAETK